jgi:hypothetical protein
LQVDHVLGNVTFVQTFFSATGGGRFLQLKRIATVL